MTYNLIRSSLFAHPDVSGSERYAHDLIVRELQKLKPDALYDHVGGYGVVAFWNATGSSLSSPTLAFRADTDALPIGHRCGHDGHTAILLDFAQTVSQTQSRPYGTLLIFQPEEETGKGAKKIIASGLLEQHNTGAVFGLHNIPGYRLATPILIRNTFAAASCGIHYKLIGRATHASTPEKGLNPGLAVAEIIEGFQRLNRKGDNNTFRQSTLICCRLGEEAFGTSAGEGDIMFTLRAFTNNSMNELMAEADSVAVAAAGRYRLELQKQLCEPFAATENNPALVDQLDTLFRRFTPIPPLQLTTPFRWSEDFAEYLKLYPGVFFGVGSGEEQPELHNPSYVFPDSLVKPASLLFETIMKNIKI